MKTLNFSRQSWHYQLAEFGSNSVSTNICSYIWQVLWGVIAVLAIAAVITLAVGIPLISLIFILLFGYDSEIIFGKEFNIVAVGLLITSVYVAGATLWFCIEIAPSKIYSVITNSTLTHETTSDNFLYSVWSKFKNNTCAKINFYN